jgi:hypothetical protein
VKLAVAPGAYDRSDQAQMRGALERADQQTIKRGVAEPFLLLSKPDGTVGKLSVNSSGTVIWTAL